jgi:S-DNA-T family DNA segregation ATPase FtsK/SpoIIIE
MPPTRTDKQKSAERRRQVVAVVAMVVSLLLFLSIVSYSAEDVWTSFLSFDGVADHLFQPSVGGGAEQRVDNWLGILGALIAEVLVIGSFGYFILVLPLILGASGWFVLRKKPLTDLVPFMNYSLLFALLLSTTAGAAKDIVGGVPDEFTGGVGLMLASVLIHLLGEAGATIVLLFSLFVTFVFAASVDLYAWAGRVRDVTLGMSARLRRKESAVTIQTPENEESPRRRPVSVVSRPDAEVEREEPTMPGPESSPEPLKELQVTKTVVPEEEEPEEYEPPAVPRHSPVTEEVEEIDYVFPSVELLEAPRQTETVGDEELKANAELLQAKLANFSVTIENVSVTPGPVVTLYELVPASDVKISRIVNLSDDLALALAAKGIRIIAPIPGKSAVGVEIPNHHPSMVSVRSVINSARFRDSKSALPLALGKTISGEVYVDDLAKMPHLLIAGATGSGKSVGINTILMSLLYKLHPSEVKFVIIDPKKIELALYSRLKHHFLATTPDVQQDIITSPQNAVSVLKSVELEMEKRYDRLAAAGVRNIQDYNDRIASGRLKNSETVQHRKMPYIIIVIDELADLMMTAAREVEDPIARLAQLARAVGIHLVVATQRPSVDVITGVIKANFPARIAYQVSSKVDSRTILDMNGAEQLLGSGDMLYLPAGSSKPIRLQNAFISSDEVEGVVQYIAKQQGYSKPSMLPSILERKRSGMGGGSGDRDELFEEAARLIVRHQQGSVSLLQRRLKVGYSRAARLVDELEAAGIVGPFDGSKAREVLVESESELEIILKGME